MSRDRDAIRGERKALLATRAELDRARVTLAVREIKAVVAPAPAPERITRLRPAAVLLTGLVGALAGGPRLARWLRFGSLALAAIRVVRSWK